MIKCKICGKEYESLLLHLMRTHSIKPADYKEKYPDAPLVDESLRKRLGESISNSWDEERRFSQSEIMKERMIDILNDPAHIERRREISRKTMLNNWGSQEFAEKISNSASEHLKRLWQDTEYRDRHIEISRENMIALNERMNKDPEFCARRSERSSKLFTAMNEENWKDEDYRRIASERSSRVIKETLSRLWSDEDYRAKMSIHNSNNLKLQGKGVFTTPHKIVSEYLSSIGVYHVNEELVEGIRVDIYIPEHSLVIEVNGEYWHGYHEVDMEDMTEFQRGGYLRDLRRIDKFRGKVLFLWETRDIYSGDYKSKIKAYLDKFHVSYNKG